MLWKLLTVLTVAPLVWSLRIGTSSNRLLHVRARNMSFDATTTGNKDDIGWDSHRAVTSIPASLVKEIDGNEGMRAKFEHLCRTSQVGKPSTFVTAPSSVVKIYIATTGRHLQSHRRS
jgi:hypothetical protein